MKCSKFRSATQLASVLISGKPYCAEELVEVQGKMYAKDNLDMHQQCLVAQKTPWCEAGLACHMRVIAAHAGPKRPALHRDRPLLPMALDEGALHFAPFAKYAVAFPRMSRHFYPRQLSTQPCNLHLFGGVEAHGKSPMLPLPLFRQRNFARANLLTLLLYAALGGSLFFLPLNLIQVQGYGATSAGAAFLPFIAIMFFLSRWAGTLVDVFGSKLPLVAGPAVAALGFALFAVPAMNPNYWATFFPAICVLGLGMSMTVAPLTTTVMNSVGTELAGTASGVNNAVSRAAGLLAIAIFGIVLTWVFNARLTGELARLHVTPDIVSSVLAQRQKLAGIVTPIGSSHGNVSALKHAIGVSFVAGFRWVMFLSAGLALLGSISAWLFIDGKKRSQSAHVK